MKISREEVKHVARLARLEVTEEELQRFTGQLDTILTYMDKIRNLDVSGVEPTYHALDNLQNVFRLDVVGDTLPKEKALANAPDRQAGFFRVPRIVEERE